MQPAGAGSSTLPTTAVTCAPRATAARTTAKPCLPLLRLPMKRTSSHGSRVPPTLTTTLTPAMSALGDLPRPVRWSRSKATSAIRSGSGSRPGPESAPVSRPTAGSSTTTPRSRSVATFAAVAGCCHISVCMAGAMTTGHRAVRSTLVNRSLATPCVARARKSAVAGATMTRSARWPIATWGTLSASDHTSTAIGLPERAAHVGSPTKRRAAAVGTTVTSCPASRSKRRSSTAL